MSCDKPEELSQFRAPSVKKKPYDNDRVSQPIILHSVRESEIKECVIQIYFIKFGQLHNINGKVQKINAWLYGVGFVLLF